MSDTDILDVDLLAVETGDRERCAAVVDGVVRSLATGSSTKSTNSQPVTVAWAAVGVPSNHAVAASGSDHLAAPGIATFSRARPRRRSRSPSSAMSSTSVIVDDDPG